MKAPGRKRQQVDPGEHTIQDKTGSLAGYFSFG